VISLAFLALALKRLVSRIGTTLLLISSSALAIALVVCAPVFVDAISLQILQEEIENKMETQNVPPFPVRFQAMPRYGQAMSLDEARYSRDWLADTLVRSVGLPLRATYAQADSPVFFMMAREDDPRYQNPLLAPVQITLVSDVEKHIQVIEGAAFGSLPNADDHLGVWMDPPTAERLGIQVGDVFQLSNPQNKATAPISAEILGIWEATSPQDRAYWSDRPLRLLDKRLLTTEEQYVRFVYPARPEMTYAHTWYYVLDSQRMTFARAEHYVEALRSVEREMVLRLPGGRMDISPLAELEKGLERRSNLSAVLLNFALPLLGMLFYFTVAISSMAVRFQRQEVAMLASRGTSQVQILAIKLVEVALTIALSLPLGIAGGLLLARLVGYTREFLVFALRTPVPIHLEAVDWRLVGAAVLLAALAQLAPHAAATRLTIVTFEQWRARRSVLWSGMRLLLIGFLLVTTYYAYRKLAALGSLSLIGLEPGDSSFDPVVLLAPTLFLFALAVVISELFVLFIRPVAVLGRILPSLPAYLGCTTLGREGEQYRAPIFLIVLCLSLGIFFASMGKSADQWLEDRRSYEVGADLVISLSDEPAGSLGAQSGPGIDATVWLLPTGDFEAIEGVDRATRVGEYKASVYGQQLPPMRLLGLDPTAFSQVAYFRRDFASDSLGALMNRLALQRDGLLIPTHLAEQLQMSEGEQLTLNMRVTSEVERTSRFTIVGTFDWFPTMYESDFLVLAANMDYVQSEIGGATPFDVWMRLKPGASTERILEQVWHTGAVPALRGDRAAKIGRDQQRLERVGLFGMLSLCFLAGAVVAGLGLLIHSLSSMVGQRVRYAVWHALGVRRGEIMGTISVEYVLTLLYGLVLGAGGGLWASYLYVPLFRLTDDVGQAIPPFLPVVNWQSANLIVLALGVTLLLIEAVILGSVVRLKIFETLRLGYRE